MGVFSNYGSAFDEADGSGSADMIDAVGLYRCKADHYEFSVGKNPKSKSFKQPIFKAVFTVAQSSHPDQHPDGCVRAWVKVTTPASVDRALGEIKGHLAAVANRQVGEIKQGHLLKLEQNPRGLEGRDFLMEVAGLNAEGYYSYSFRPWEESFAPIIAAAAARNSGVDVATRAADNRYAAEDAVREDDETNGPTPDEPVW